MVLLVLNCKTERLPLEQLNSCACVPFYGCWCWTLWKALALQYKDPLKSRILSFLSSFMNMVNENASSQLHVENFGRAQCDQMVHLCHTLKKEESERVTAHPENDSFFKILKGSLFIRPPKRYKFSKFSLGSMYIPFH